MASSVALGPRTGSQKALLQIGNNDFSLSEMNTALEELKVNDAEFATPAWKPGKDNSLFNLERRPLTSSTSMPQIRNPFENVNMTPVKKLSSQHKSRRLGSTLDRSEVPISTVKSKGGTWQYVGKLEGASETPNFRSAIAALERRFRSAMEVVEKRQSALDTASRGSARENGVSSFESDFIAMRGQVDTHFTMREAINAAVSENKMGHNNSQTMSPVLTLQQQSYGSTRISLPSLTTAFWEDTKDMLSKCLYEQKWTDLVTSELSTQLSVSCVEHGRILRDVRVRIASVFERMAMLHSDALWQLDAAVAALRESRAAAADFDKIRQEAEKRVHDSYADKMAAMERTLKEKEDLAEAGQKESNEQVSRMGDTLRTLNGLFKDIQADTDAVNAIELKEKVAKLESDLKEAKSEVTALRPLKHENALLRRVELQLKKVEERSEDLAQELKEKKQLVNELMARNSDLMAEREVKQSNEREASIESADEDMTENSAPKSPEKEEGSDDDLNEDIVIGGGTVMCVRCRKALDDLTNIREAANESSTQQRLQCHAYRLLLPNLQGFRPPRSISWVRFCMRAIIFSKIKSDDAIQTTTTDAKIESFEFNNLRYRPLRFPEFVYTWFESASTKAIPSDDDGPPTYDQNRGKEIATADDNRWGLYYGVKLLARESIEAKFFWTMLDESHGEDYLTFYTHCISTVVKLAGEKAVDQFGQTLVGITGEDAFDHIAGPTETGEDNATNVVPGVQEMVFIDMEVMISATEQVLANSTEMTVLKYIDATRKIAVDSQDRIKDPASPRCVDLFLWLRIIMAMYRQDQVHRRAAVRLMFETAVSGVITIHRPLYGDGRNPETETKTVSGKPPRVDFPQLLSILRTLDESIDCHEAAAIFRDAHESSDGKVCTLFFPLHSALGAQSFTSNLVLLYCLYSSDRCGRVF